MPKTKTAKKNKYCKTKFPGKYLDNQRDFRDLRLDAVLKQDVFSNGNGSLRFFEANRTDEGNFGRQTGERRFGQVLLAVHDRLQQMATGEAAPTEIGRIYNK